MLSLLPETVSRVDDLVAQAQLRGRVPTLTFGVVRDGALLHVASSGAAPAAVEDLQFRVGAITKSMTAVLVMALRDEGHLALDDLLYRHLPGTPVGGVTLRQLLGHVGGMQREPDGEWWERAGGTDLETFLADLTPDKVAYPPLRGYHYSNLAYGLLGAVINRVAGHDWAELMVKKLLEPLGMARTTYHPVEPFARGYVVHPWHNTLREEPRPDTGAMAPAGQLWSTVGDLAKWAAFLAEPDPAVLAPPSVTEMCAPVVISDLATWSRGHGLGLELGRRGERVFVGHSGSMPGYLSTLTVHRPSRTAVVGLANAYTLHGDTLWNVGLEVLCSVLDREPAPVVPFCAEAPPPPELEPLTGRWWWMGREFGVAWDGVAQELIVTPLTTGEEPWRFTADGPDRWMGRSGENDGEILRVRRDGAGDVSGLDIARMAFTRTP
jgi:CubicO group peptidase (beta-lactamase class C family)